MIICGTLRLLSIFLWLDTWGFYIPKDGWKPHGFPVKVGPTNGWFCASVTLPLGN